MLTETYEIKEYDLKILKLRANGATYREIARDQNTSERTVQRRLERLKQIWPDVRNFVFKIEKSEHVKVLLTGKMAPEKPQVRWMRRQFENGYHPGPPPYGYKKDASGKLIEVLEEVELVKEIFRGYHNGKSLSELSRETGLKFALVVKIVHNLVYKGWVRFRGDTRRGKHKSIVTEELWDSVQKIKPNCPFGLRMLPFGYKYEKGRVIIDHGKAEKIKQMFRLRLERKNFAEIRRALGWPVENVRQRVKNPFYAALQRVDGKLVPTDDHPAIVDPELWKTANEIEIKKWEPVIQKKRRIAELNKSRILAFLHEEGEKTSRQIQEKLNLSRFNVHRRLRELESEGLVERLPPKHMRKDGLFSPFLWRVGSR